MSSNPKSSTDWQIVLPGGGRMRASGDLEHMIDVCQRLVDSPVRVHRISIRPVGIA